MLYNLLCPRLKVKTVYDIDFQLLKDQGICGFIFDLDNTLVPWNSEQISSNIFAWLKSVQALGSKICLVSNNHKRKRVRDFAAMFGIPFVSGAFKPAKFGFRQALQLMALQPRQVAVVGDQMFTDILGGNRMGLYTIWVEPLNNKEFIGTRLTRRVERFTVKLLQHKGLLK